MPELPALATLEELAAWMQTDVGSLPASASLVLDTASAIVRGEARQHFTRRTTTVTMYPSWVETDTVWGTRRAWGVTLPQRPVISVDSVRNSLDAPVGFVLRRDKLTFESLSEAVSVTFTHGYAETPGDVKAVVLSAASRVLNNPSDIRQEAVGSLSVTYAAETIGASLAQADKDLLARYRRRAASVRWG
jgi:hypothetical protein